jgi:hypothetical protein
VNLKLTNYKIADSATKTAEHAFPDYPQISSGKNGLVCNVPDIFGKSDR